MHGQQRAACRQMKKEKRALLLLLAACCLPTAAVWSEAKFKLLKRKRPSENPTKFLTEGNWKSKIIYVKYIENYLAKNENNLELQQIGKINQVRVVLQKFASSR